MKTPVTNIAKVAKITNLTRNQDLETEEAKKGPEMSANIAKIAKVIEDKKRPAFLYHPNHSLSSTSPFSPLTLESLMHAITSEQLGNEN